MKKRSILLSSFTLSLLIAALLLYINIPRSKINRLTNGYVKVELKNKQAIFHITSKKPKYWVELSQISKPAWQAIMISEDWSFFAHDGLDYNQLMKSLEEYAFDGKALRGASTITQQVVKNLFYGPEKTILRKLKEAATTMYMERRIEKKKILEIYLNMLHLGPDLYGIKKASRYYFNKKPQDLNALEGAYLSYLLPNPNKYHHTFKDRALTDFAKEKITKILNFMKMAKFINDEELARFLKLDLNFIENLKRNELKEKIKGFKNAKSRFKKRKKKRSYENKFKRDNDLDLNEEPVLEGLDDEPQLEVIEAEFNDD